MKLSEDGLYFLSCPTCGSKDLIKKGTQKSAGGNYRQRYLCNSCGTKTIYPIKNDLEVVRENVKLAKQKHDIIAIAITDPREHTLPANIGRVHLEDTETGESIFVDTGDKEIIENFQRIKEEEKVNRDKFFQSAGLDIIEIYTDQPLIDPIIRFFKMREKKH